MTAKTQEVLGVMQMILTYMEGMDSCIVNKLIYSLPKNKAQVLIMYVLYLQCVLFYCKREKQ